MSLFVIMHKRSECIGCGLCVETAPDYWEMNDEGEAQLCSVCRTEGPYECSEAAADDGVRVLAASRGCPVNIIRVR